MSKYTVVIYTEPDHKPKLYPSSVIDLDFDPASNVAKDPDNNDYDVAEVRFSSDDGNGTIRFHKSAPRINAATIVVAQGPSEGKKAYFGLLTSAAPYPLSVHVGAAEDEVGWNFAQIGANGSTASLKLTVRIKHAP